MDGHLTIRRVWRSQLKPMGIYFVLCLVCVLLSRYMPGSVIHGKLFSVGSLKLYLAFPLFSLIPLAALGNLILPIYDTTFKIDRRGIELRDGILSMRQRVNRVRFEDIRNIELEQTLVERALNVGTIGIATAATGTIEILMDGIGSPEALHNMIQTERDKRLRAKMKTGLVANATD